MKNIAVVFPHQLFEIENIPYNLKEIDVFIIVEDPLFFCDDERYLKFNLLKLIYQRASMKYYENYLKKNKFDVDYVDYDIKPSLLFDFIKSKYGTKNNVLIIDPIDYILEQRIEKYSKNQNVTFYDSPMFLMNDEDLKNYMKGKKKYFQHDFYVWFRQNFNILMNKNGKPIGTTYSFDKFNRDKIPGDSFEKFLKEKNIEYPEIKYKNQYYKEAIQYCEKTFDNHYQKNYEPKNIYLYPITHEDIKKHFKNFLNYKMKYFGPYEDAIDFEEVSMFHSVISPQLNNGLLNPKWVLDQTIEYYESKGKNMLASIEGFIRQLVWREYSRLLYRYAYSEMISNYFKHENKLNRNWYEGTTGILPIDLSIQSAFRYGYLHHIIRLMILCNFMNLCQINPHDVYAWFMEFSLDSYDWVMINNVYSMGLYADGGLTTTKPYISTSKYVLNQSNLKKDGVWDETWDVLYYYFINRNFKLFKGRGKIYQGQWNKKSNKDEIIKKGKKYIDELVS